MMDLARQARSLRSACGQSQLRLKFTALAEPRLHVAFLAVPSNYNYFLLDLDEQVAVQHLRRDAK
jgi:hypothetical protein